MKLITLYLHTQCYGGPEEGGWWYDHRELASETPSLVASDEATAYEICRALNAIEREEAEERGDAEYTSVLSQGDLRGWGVESERGEDVTVGRPHYC